MEQKVLRAGALALVFALLLRLFGPVPDLSASSLSPKIASLILLLQTGRLVRPSQIVFSPAPTEPSAPDDTTPTDPVQEILIPTFSAQDAEGLKINCSFSHTADVPRLLTQPLQWDLTGSKPTVLILHTHGTESFAPTGEYVESTPYHTTDTANNMISVGAYVAELLEKGGISVLQDTSLHDTPSYNAAYTNSRKSIEDYLQEYPSIRLVLDLHRDSFEDEAGNQLVQTVFSQNTTYAPLMFVVGTDNSGLTHPNWQNNLSLALKLQTQLEDICPGICRDISLRAQRFNQDLCGQALLVEVGASGNTRQEALRSAGLLAEGILSLAHGSK
ncbi:MAG: stage II sporulation protein P [Oscillospiraceae bacterium]|nr:stage II sporulation protein P [Oscillospiraceae bacterium]